MFTHLNRVKLFVMNGFVRQLSYSLEQVFFLLVCVLWCRPHCYHQNSQTSTCFTQRPSVWCGEILVFRAKVLICAKYSDFCNQTGTWMHHWLKWSHKWVIWRNQSQIQSHFVAFIRFHNNPSHITCTVYVLFHLVFLPVGWFKLWSDLWRNQSRDDHI